MPSTCLQGVRHLQTTSASILPKDAAVFRPPQIQQLNLKGSTLFKPKFAVGGPLSELKAAAPELADSLARNIEQCLAEATTAGTQSTYESTLKIVFEWFPQSTWNRLIPCLSAEHLMLVFAPLAGRAWGTIRVAKAALRQWHFAQGFSELWEAASISPEFNSFWRGLKRGACHKSNATQALPIQALVSILRACTSGHDTLAGIRDAAWLS